MTDKGEYVHITDYLGHPVCAVKVGERDPEAVKSSILRISHNPHLLNDTLDCGPLKVGYPLRRL